MKKYRIPPSHPKYQQLLLRSFITESCKKGITAPAGLLAHGRGEAFDYLMGEKTPEYAYKSIEAAAALFLLSSYPVICVNGNSVVLTPIESVELARILNAKIEVNLFYRSTKREKLIAKELKKAGAQEVLGVELKKRAKYMNNIDHARGVIDPEGVFLADTVFVPLEDGDRTEALIKSGKKVITVDLNPFSRTAQMANITIVDNITRCLPLLISKIEELKGSDPQFLQSILDKYDNKSVLKESLNWTANRLLNYSFDKKGNK